MKKKLLITFALCCVIMNGCSEPGSVESASSRESATEETQEPENETKETKEIGIELPAEFEVLTEEQLTLLPDTDELASVVGMTLESIGVQSVENAVYGNYETIGTVCINIDTYVITDLRKLIIRNQYLNEHWQVIYINDAETDNLYYPVTAQNAYDYVSGECINPVEETEEPPHREGMCGISDKDVYDIGSPSVFERNDVRNDTTGNWKVSTIAEDVQMVDYALSYYEKYFYNDSEVHCIVNFTNKTTTCIQYMSGQIYVTVHEYVDGEEHDVNVMFSGMVLADFIVYPDNGDIEKIQ